MFHDEGGMGLRPFVETVSMEVFVNGNISRYMRQPPGKTPVRLVAADGVMKINFFRIHRLRSVWK